jgi:hypothetical protein
MKNIVLTLLMLALTLVIYGQKKETVKTVAVNEKNVSYIKHGEKIILKTTRYIFKFELIPNELFVFMLRSDPGNNNEDEYKYINKYCVIDKKGVLKEFGGEKYFEQIERHVTYTFNEKNGTNYEWGLVTVKSFYKKEDRYGASYHAYDEDEIEASFAKWGSDNSYPNNFSNIHYDQLVLTDEHLVVKHIHPGFYILEQMRPPHLRPYFKTEFNRFPLDAPFELINIPEKKSTSTSTSTPSKGYISVEKKK